jgi:hypothetical protein
VLRDAKIELGRMIANFVHVFGNNNLTTVGCFRVECIETYAAYTDSSPAVIMATRELTISRALQVKAYGEKYGKPMLQTEVGYLGRAGPCDMALREGKLAYGAPPAQRQVVGPKPTTIGAARDEAPPSRHE